MEQISRKYTNASILGRLVVISAAIIFIVFMIMNANSGQQPEDFHAFIDAKGGEVLALREWMQENDLDAIKLLNKSNRKYGNGVSIQVGKLYCYFEGSGTDELFGMANFDGFPNATEKAFDLEQIAEDYGAYAYITQVDMFEIMISGDPVKRMGGMEGTSVFYSELPLSEIDTGAAIGVSEVEDIGDGWFLDISEKSSFNQINIDSELFRILAIVVSFIMITLIISLFYKRHECNAKVIEKNSEYIGNRPRILNHIRGAYAGIFEDFTVYKVTFLTDQNKKLNIYVPKPEFDRLYEKAYGSLEYKRLWKRCKYVCFKIAED